VAKRIAIISEHASPVSALGGVDQGGQNVYVAHTARQLRALGHSVDVFTRRDSIHQPQVTTFDGDIGLIHVPAGPPRALPKEKLFEYMPEFANYMIHYCERQFISYDIIHANFWMSGFVAAQIKRMLDIPFVITFHALGRVRRLYQRDQDLFPDIRFQVEDRIVAEADHIIAECPQDQLDLIRLYHADPRRISMVPCGFDPHELKAMSQAEARAMIGLKSSIPVVLQLGRLVPRKGVDNAIRGFAHFKKAWKKDALMLIVGGESDQPDPHLTPEIGRLAEVAIYEGVSDEVVFCGRKTRDEITKYFHAADVFISTPWYEPFGITPVEAMACGRPVIGSRVGGIKFSVVDGETGFLVPANDPRAISTKLLKLFRNRFVLGEMSEKAKKRAYQHFTWRRVAEQLDYMYEMVLYRRAWEAAMNIQGQDVFKRPVNG
jgi:glycosyltransferase involved in cell wall biosynthesis